MKICITATGPNLDSMVDPRFGRCQYLIFTDSKTGKILESVSNTDLMAMQGAGIAVAQAVASKGAKAVITGNVGPNAFWALSSAGIKIYPGILDLTVKQALDKYQKGQLEEAPQPTVTGHFGISPGSPGFGLPGRGAGMERGGRGAGPIGGAGRGRGRGGRP